MRLYTCREHGKHPHDINSRCQVCEYQANLGVKLVPVTDKATQRTVYQVAR